MFEKLDYGPGRVSFSSNDLWEEDILQVDYPEGYLLDLGWYGESNGFIVYIVKDQNWEDPIKKYSCLCMTEIEDILRMAVKQIQGLLEPF